MVGGWVRCRSENGHQTDIMCYKEIGLRAQNVLPILGPIVNTVIGWTYVAFFMMAHSQWTLIIHNNSRLAPTFLEMIMALSDPCIRVRTKRIQPCKSEGYLGRKQQEITK